MPFSVFLTPIVLSLFFVFVSAGYPTCTPNQEGCNNKLYDICVCEASIQQCRTTGGTCGLTCSGVCEYTSLFYAVVIGIPLLVIALCFCCCRICCSRGGGSLAERTILLVAPGQANYTSVPIIQTCSRCGAEKSGNFCGNCGK